MSNKDQESGCEKQTTCLHKPHGESVVRAVMFAIVASILGSAMFSISQSADNPVVMEEVHCVAGSDNCCSWTQSLIAKKIVCHEEREGRWLALFRALSLFLFCASYFGDEWLGEHDNDERPKTNDSVQDNPQRHFVLDFIGWLLISVQACLVGNRWLFAVFGAMAACAVSVNILSQNELKEEHKCWLCENLIWIASLFLFTSWPVGILVSSLLIMLIKIAGWVSATFYKRTFKSKGLYYVLMFLAPIVLLGTRWIVLRI